MSGFMSDGDLSPNRIELARQRRQQTGGYIDLTSSNPTHQGLLFPPTILQQTAERYFQSRRYDPEPQGALSARMAIVDYYARRSPPLMLQPNDIFITASTSEAYSLLFALLTEPGDNLLAPEVSYPLFEYLAAIHHIDLRPYKLDEGEHWQIDPDSLLVQADRRTRAVLVISPHNPTGMIIQEAMPALRLLGVPVICDEVFAEFTYAISATPPLGTLHPELSIFHLNGISKMFALPDLKLGWIALSRLATLRYGERLELLNDTFLGANSLTQSMLPTLFVQGMEFVAAMRCRIRSNIELALRMLANSPRLEVHPPDGGYYLFPRVVGLEEEEDLVIQLLEHGVLVHPGYFYGYADGAHLMISCLTQPDQLAKGIERLLRGLELFS